ncbi:MAG: hypothetical protein ACRDTE_25540 [Pseudonocardiaceae bacterium]
MRPARSAALIDLNRDHHAYEEWTHVATADLNAPRTTEARG